jgi:hypothetical protein
MIAPLTGIPESRNAGPKTSAITPSAKVLARDDLPIFFTHGPAFLLVNGQQMTHTNGALGWTVR